MTTQVAKGSDRERATRSALRVALLIMLLLSAAFALLGQPRIVAMVRGEELAPEWLWLAPAAFCLFVALTAVDAIVVARKRGFMSGRALVQVFFALAFVAFLVPQAYAEYRARMAPPSASAAMLETLARHGDARVRAVVMDLAGYRADEKALGRLLRRGLEDKDPMVRDAALDATQRRYGGTAPLSLDEAKAVAQEWLDAASQAAP